MLGLRAPGETPLATLRPEDSDAALPPPVRLERGRPGAGRVLLLTVAAYQKPPGA